MNPAVEVQTGGPAPGFQARDAPSPCGWAPSAAGSCASWGGLAAGHPLLTSLAKPEGTLTTPGRSPAITQASALTLFGRSFGLSPRGGQRGLQTLGAEGGQQGRREGTGGGGGLQNASGRTGRAGCRDGSQAQLSRLPASQGWGPGAPHAAPRPWLHMGPGRPGTG